MNWEIPQKSSVKIPSSCFKIEREKFGHQGGNCIVWDNVNDEL